MYYFISVIAGVLPPLVLFFLFKGKGQSKVKQADLEKRLEMIRKKIDEINSIDLESLYPLKAFEEIKEKKDELSAEIVSIQNNLKNMEERVKELSLKLEEKEKYHQQLKLPNPAIEELADKILIQTSQEMEKFGIYENELAELLSSLETIESLDNEKIPYKNNFHEITLQFGSLTREALLLLKDIREKITSLRSQIEDLEVEFSKLLEKQISK